MVPGREFRSLEFLGSSTADRAQRGFMLYFPKGAITIELWMRRDVGFPAIMQALIGCKSYSGTSHELVLWAADNQLVLEIKDQVAWKAFCPLTAGIWAHYAFSWDNALGRVQCTKNGVLQNSQNDVAKDMTFDSQIAMMIGQDYGNTLTTENAFRGGLSQLRIWNTVLSNRAIAYAKEMSYPQSLILNGFFLNMIAYYEFPQYFTGTDLSGKNNHLTIVGRVESVLPVPAPTSLSMAYSERSLLMPPNHPSTGAASVVLTGAAFGAVDYTGQSRGRHFSACEATEWLSTTCIRVRVASAISASRTTKLTVGIFANSISFAFSVDLTGGSSSYLANTASTGSHSVTIKGFGFGLRDQTSFFKIEPTAGEISSWISDSTMRSLVSSSISSTRRVSITTGALRSTWSEVFSHDSRMGMHSAVMRTNLPSTGSTTVTLVGASFGQHPGTVKIRLGHSVAEASCWFSTTGIIVRVMHGIEGSRRVSVTSRLSPGTYTSGLSFDTAKTQAHPFRQLRNHAATGSIQVTVTGSDFGQNIFSSTSRSLSSSCEATRWTSGESYTYFIFYFLYYSLLICDHVLCRNIVDIKNSVWLWCNRSFACYFNYANRNCNTNIFIQRPRCKPHARKSVLTAKINGRHWVL